MPVHPDLLAAAEGRRSPGFRPGEFLGPRHERVTWAAAQAPGLWLMGGGERLLERSQPGVLHRDLAACNAYGGAPAAAEAVSCPTLLVLGADDKMTPAKAGRKLADMIPGAQVAAIAGSGHMMMTEQPDDTLDALKSIF